jgi:hypothetical protein
MAANKSTITATILPKRAMNQVSVRKSLPVRPGVRLGSCPMGSLECKIKFNIYGAYITHL